MLIIRLRRIGKKNKPTYRVVVAEHSYPVNGKFTADLGFYNPHSKKVSLSVEDVKLWLDKGAKPSNTVAKILEKEKVKHASVTVVKRNRKPKKEVATEAAPKSAPESKAAEVTTETESPAQAAVDTDNSQAEAVEDSKTDSTDAEPTSESDQETPAA